MESLITLFGSSARVKLMKLFLFNGDHTFGMQEIAKRAQVSLDAAKKELAVLEKAEFVKRRTFSLELKGKSGRKTTKKVVGFVLNHLFDYLPQFQALLIHAASIDKRSMVRALNKAGNIKLVVTSGIFTQNEASKVDLLVVGEGMKARRLEQAMKTIESEIGKEVRYVLLKTDDFKYRLGLYDRLLRDIFDYPHQTIVDKLGLNSLVYN